jgi:hypothetical protein
VKRLQGRKTLELSGERRSCGNVEDRAMAFLAKTLGKQLLACFEFSRADALYTISNSKDEPLYARIQVKSAERDVNSKKSNWFTFGHVEGYGNVNKDHRMVILFVGTIMKDGKAVEKYVWAVDGSQIPNNGSKRTNIYANRKKGFLKNGKQRIPEVKNTIELKAEIEKIIQSDDFPLVTEAQAYADIPGDNHRKEYVSISNFQYLPDKPIVTRDRCNQSDIDCYLNGVPTQIKAVNYDSQGGVCCIDHRVKGKEKQPYSVQTAQFQQIVVIFKFCTTENGSFQSWQTHAILPFDLLREKGYFFDEEANIAGKTCITLPFAPEVLKRVFGLDKLKRQELQDPDLCHRWCVPYRVFKPKGMTNKSYNICRGKLVDRPGFTDAELEAMKNKYAFAAHKQTFPIKHLTTQEQKDAQEMSALLNSKKSKKRKRDDESVSV